MAHNVEAEQTVIKPQGFIHIAHMQMNMPDTRLCGDGHVDAIILAPVVETGWEPVLREVKRAKIPVILVDRGIKVGDQSLYTTLIASDFVSEGRMAGEWLAKKLGGKGNIVELQGTAGAAPANDRKKGFAEVIQKHPGMKVIKSQSGDFTRAKGKEVMEAFLKAEGKNINAVYAHNDDMALGALQAIEDHPNHLLAQGVAGGDVEEVLGGSWSLMS